MNLTRVWYILRKDLKLGPRGSLFLFAVVMPVVITLILQGAFGTLFEPEPRLGIVDAGRSEITAAVEQMDGITLIQLDDAQLLKTRVEKNDLDAGLILPQSFDEAVRRGERPELELYVGGQSLASNRIILMVTALDLVRSIEGTADKVVVRTVQIGQEGLPISVRLVPVMVFYALVLAGIWIPASSLVEEREKRTLTALLVTPVRKSEVLMAKWVLGVILSSVLSLVTLLLNNAYGPHPLDVVIVILVASVMVSTLALVVGVLAKTATDMYILVKGAGVILFAPAIFYVFPDWPQWIARLFPLYWIIEPIWQVSVLSQVVSKVWFELMVAGLISVLLIPVIAVLSSRMES